MTPKKIFKASTISLASTARSNVSAREFLLYFRFYYRICYRLSAMAAMEASGVGNPTGIITALTGTSSVVNAGTSGNPCGKRCLRLERVDGVEGVCA